MNGAPYRLKIGRTLDVPVKFTLRDGARDVPFTVTLQCQRPSLEEFGDLIDQVRAGTLSDRELLDRLVLGWTQALVLGEDDKPAAYSAEAMDAMCAVISVRAQLVRGVFETLAGSFAPAEQAGAKLGN